MIGRTNADGVSANTDELSTLSSDVLSGKKFIGSGSDEPQTGTMPNQGAKTASLNCGNSYTIPAGYHNGSGKVTANALPGQTSGTATAAQILSGQTAWVNGNKITGSMANQGAKTSSLNAGGSYAIPAGYHNGSGKVTANSLSSQTSATATAPQIWTGKTAWVNGSKLTGTLAAQGGSTTTPGTSNKTIVTANKIVTGNIVVAGDANLKATNIKKGITIFGVKGTWQGYVDSPYYIYKQGTWTGLHTTGISCMVGSGYEKGDNTIWIGSKGISTPGLIRLNSTFDITNYEYLTVNFTAQQPVFDYVIGISSNSTITGYSNLEAHVKSSPDTTHVNNNYTLILNISKFNSSKYIYIGVCRNDGYWTQFGYLQIDKIFLSTT